MDDVKRINGRDAMFLFSRDFVLAAALVSGHTSLLVAPAVMGITSHIVLCREIESVLCVGSPFKAILVACSLLLSRFAEVALADDLRPEMVEHREVARHSSCGVLVLTSSSQEEHFASICRAPPRLVGP